MRTALTFAGGNTKTGIIITISPSSTNISETYGSLMFALRAKQVTFLYLFVPLKLSSHMFGVANLCV